MQRELQATAPPNEVSYLNRICGRCQNTVQRSKLATLLHYESREASAWADFAAYIVKGNGFGEFYILSTKS